MSDDASRDEREALKEEEDMMNNASGTVKLSAEDIKRMRNATLEDIAKGDVPVVTCVNQFFENHVNECEEILDKNMYNDPLMMCGAGLITFLRYILSMEQGYADKALTRLGLSVAFASQLYGESSGAITKLFYGKKKTMLKPAEYRAKTIYAESQALRAFGLVLQNSITALMKAGLAVNKAYGAYHSLLHEYEDWTKHGEKNEPMPIDPNSLNSVFLGYGCIKVVISILPPSTISMLRFLGFTGDWDEGVAMIRRCFESNTLLSPFASAFLLWIFGMMPASCSPTIPLYLPEARAVMQQCLAAKNMKRSVLHLWEMGSVDRLERKVDSSISQLQICLDISKEDGLDKTMPQLRDFAQWDLAYCYMIMHRWPEAIECFDSLDIETKWSAIFYKYSKACCYEIMAVEAEAAGNTEEASKLRRKATDTYWLAVHQKVTMLGGKPHRYDLFVTKRLDEMVAWAGLTHPNPGYKAKVEKVLPLGDDVCLPNTVPLAAYEMLASATSPNQTPAAMKNRVIAAVDAQLAREVICRSDTQARFLMDKLKIPCTVIDGPAPSPSSLVSQKGTSTPSLHSESSKVASPNTKDPGTLPDAYRLLSLLFIKAEYLTDSEDVHERQTALPIIQAVMEVPRYKDKAWSLSFVQPYLLYSQAVLAYEKDGAEACDKYLGQFDKAYSSGHYYFHNMTETRVYYMRTTLHRLKKVKKAEK